MFSLCIRSSLPTSSQTPFKGHFWKQTFLKIAVSDMLCQINSFTVTKCSAFIMKHSKHIYTKRKSYNEPSRAHHLAAAINTYLCWLICVTTSHTTSDYSEVNLRHHMPSVRLQWVSLSDKDSWQMIWYKLPVCKLHLSPMPGIISKWWFSVDCPPCQILPLPISLPWGLEPEESIREHIYEPPPPTPILLMVRASQPSNEF